MLPDPQILQKAVGGRSDGAAVGAVGDMDTEGSSVGETPASVGVADGTSDTAAVTVGPEVSARAKIGMVGVEVVTGAIEGTWAATEAKQRLTGKSDFMVDFSKRMTCLQGKAAVHRCGAAPEAVVDDSFGMTGVV